jgi:hypothetical protein
MTASKADIAYEWELWVGRESETPGTYDFTQIFGLEDLPFPQQVPEQIDVTHMQSPGRAREEIPGMLPVAEASLTKQYWPDDDGDILLEALADLAAAGDKEDVLFEFYIPDGARRTYRGYVNAFNPTGSVGDKAMVAVEMRIFNRVDDERTLPGS